MKSFGLRPARLQAPAGGPAFENMDEYINKIICGDCLEVMKDCSDGCVDLVVTDPPYNLGKNYGTGHNDRLPEKEYWELVRKWTEAWYRLLGDGYCYVSHSDKGIYRLKPQMEASGFKYNQQTAAL